MLAYTAIWAKRWSQKVTIRAVQASSNVTTRGCQGIPTKLEFRGCDMASTCSPGRRTSWSSYIHSGSRKVYVHVV